MFLWIVVVAELIIILFLLNRKPQTIYKDIGKEYELQYEKEKNEKLSKLSKELSEEKENSLSKIHQYEKEKMTEIEEIRNKEYETIKEQYKIWQEEENKKFEDFKKQQQELKEAKRKELQDEIQKDFEILDSKKKETEEEILEIQDKLNDWRSKYDAAIQAYKELDKEKQAEDFYRIVFSESELEELTELNKVIRKLKNPMPFYKAIYEIYYKHKVSDLTKRVVGKHKTAGIYKITHIESGKCYVGQSVDIANRWKQHIKRGVGADKITQNKLYPALMKLGVHNFTFEIVETTEDTNKLNDMEKYWQEFLGAKEFGYSVR